MCAGSASLTKRAFNHSNNITNLKDINDYNDITDAIMNYDIYRKIK